MNTSVNCVVILILMGGAPGEGETRSSPPAKSAAAIADPLAAEPSAETKPRQEERFYRFLPGTKISLKPRKDKYFLGENILLDYRVLYEGEGRVDVWNPDGLRSDYCHVMATNQAGQRVPECTMRFDEGGSGGSVLRRGVSDTLTIPLMRFCRLEKPGVYRVRAAFDLGWSKGDYSQPGAPAVPENDPRWAETSIIVAMPDDVQARRVVEHMRQLRSAAHDAHPDCWNPSDYADFTCLQYPVYLPILEELATGNGGDEEALTGIAHIPAPEATEALVRLLKHPNKAFALKVAGALNDRLPEPQAAQRGKRSNPVRLADADP